MFKLKEKKVIDQELTIYDFIRLWFDDCVLSDLDTNKPFGFFLSGKWKLTPEEEDKNILKFGLSPAYVKTDSYKFFSELFREINSEKSNFPKCKYTKTIPNDFIKTKGQQFEFYLVSDIVDWLSDNLAEIDLDVMPHWAKNYLTVKYESQSMLLNYDSDNEYIKIESLPKFIQLMIKTYLRTNWILKPDNKAITKIAIEVAKEDLNIPNTPTLKTGSGIGFLFPKKGDNSEESMSKKIMEVLPKIVKPNSK